MINFRRVLFASANQKNVLPAATALCRSFSSKGKDPKTTTVTVTVPRGTEKNEPFDEHTNWELLGTRGYRFILPGNIGLSPARRKPSNPKKSSRAKKYKNSQATLPDTTYYRQVEILTQLAVLASELSFKLNNQPKEFQCKAVDCPFLLREQVIDLFPRAGLGYGPLTAVCVALRSPESEKSEKDWDKVVGKFEETARRVCGKLNQAGYWADFPTEIEFDMSKLSTDVSAFQIEAANMLRRPAPRVVHISGCIIVMHPANGDSKVLGWLFTTASFDDPKLQNILEEENN